MKDRFRILWLLRALTTCRAFDLVGYTYPALRAFVVWNFHLLKTGL